MSEDGLLEEDIWEYKSIRKQKHQSNSQSISTPVQEVSDGKGRPKRKRNRKKKSTEKTGTPQKTKQSSRPGQDVDYSKEDSSVLSQESVSSLAEQGSQNAKPVHDGFCPSCQMPFSLLLVQTPQWHVYECLETPGPIEKGMNRVRKRLSETSCRLLMKCCCKPGFLKFSSKSEMVVDMTSIMLCYVVTDQSYFCMKFLLLYEEHGNLT